MKKCDTLNMYSLFPKLSLINDHADPCHDQKEFFTVEVKERSCAITLAAVCRVALKQSIAAAVCCC